MKNPQTVPGQTRRRDYRTDRREIAYIKFIFEAYEGIAMLTTIDPAAGRIALFTAPGCEETVDAVLKDLAEEIPLIPVSPMNPVT